MGRSYRGYQIERVKTASITLGFSYTSRRFLPPIKKGRGKMMSAG
jgi:hypothetical protein